MHGTITWTTSTQCIGRRKEGCDKPSLKVQTTASTTDLIQRPWCGVRYTMRWCSFTPLRMVVTLRNVKCKILGYFLVKERHPLTWNPFVNNSIVNWNSSFPSWLTIVIIPLNQGWGPVSPSRILDVCSLIPPTWKIWFLLSGPTCHDASKTEIPSKENSTISWNLKSTILSKLSNLIPR